MEKNLYIGKKAELEYIIDYGIEGESYENTLDLLHPDIKFKHISTGDYQGNIFSLGIDKNKNYFYKNNSYGSCSGCDWLQSIKTKKEAEEFYKNQEVLDELGSDVNRVKEYLTKEMSSSWDFKEEQLKEFFNWIDELQKKD